MTYFISDTNIDQISIYVVIITTFFTSFAAAAVSIINSIQSRNNQQSLKRVEHQTNSAAEASKRDLSEDQEYLHTANEDLAAARIDIATLTAQVTRLIEKVDSKEKLQEASEIKIEPNK